MGGMKVSVRLQVPVYIPLTGSGLSLGVEGFRVQGSGFRGLGFRGLGVQGFRVQGFRRFRGSGLGV